MCVGDSVLPYAIVFLVTIFIAGLVLAIYGIFVARESVFWITGIVIMVLVVIAICVCLVPWNRCKYCYYAGEFLVWSHLQIVVTDKAIGSNELFFHEGPTFQ